MEEGNEAACLNGRFGPIKVELKHGLHVNALPFAHDSSHSVVSRQHPAVTLSHSFKRTHRKWLASCSTSHEPLGQVLGLVCVHAHTSRLVLHTHSPQSHPHPHALHHFRLFLTLVEHSQRSPTFTLQMSSFYSQRITPHSQKVSLQHKESFRNIHSGSIFFLLLGCITYSVQHTESSPSRGMARRLTLHGWCVFSRVFSHRCMQNNT